MTDLRYREIVFSRYASHRIGGFPTRPGDKALSNQIAISRFRNWLPADRGAAIADLGCGSGELLAALRSTGFKNLVGVDLSAEQVAIARQAGFSVELGTASEFLSKSARPFECLLAFDVVEHLTKDELFDFLEACHRGLIPGGSLIIQTPNAGSPFGMEVRYGDISHEICFDVDSLRHVLELTAFADFRARECGPIAHGVRSAARLAAWKLLRTLIAVYNLVETGSAQCGIYTRVFLARARKPPA